MKNGGHQMHTYGLGRHETAGRAKTRAPRFNSRAAVGRKKIGTPAA